MFKENITNEQLIKTLSKFKQNTAGVMNSHHCGKDDSDRKVFLMNRKTLDTLCNATSVYHCVTFDSNDIEVYTMRIDGSDVIATVIDTLSDWQVLCINSDMSPDNLFSKLAIKILKIVNEHNRLFGNKPHNLGGIKND